MQPDAAQEIRQALHPVLRSLIALAEHRNLHEMEWEDGTIAVRLRRAVSPPVEPVAETLAAVEPVEEIHEGHLLPVTSTLVGTFRISGGPRPGTRMGDTVEVGQVLAWVESMRLMNEIKAPSAGRVAEILVEEGNPVEYGQPLLVIEETAV